MEFIFNFAQKTTNNKLFSGFILFLILLSALISGLETYPSITSKYNSILLLVDSFIILCFAIEIGLKILAYKTKPWRFFTDPWNVFDFIIVAICLIPASDTHFFAILRILRVLRVLRMITFFPKLRLLIGALLKSIPSMGYVILLIAILFYMYAIVGVFIFGATDPMHFGDLHHTLVTLFKVLTLEGWTDIMNTHIYSTSTNGNMQIVSFWPFFYFASFILIGAMIIMNLFIGVIMNSMQESQNELDQESKLQRINTNDSEKMLSEIMSKLDDLRDQIQSLNDLKKH